MMRRLADAGSGYEYTESGTEMQGLTGKPAEILRSLASLQMERSSIRHRQS
jgi:hypothetical protein